MAQKNMTKFKKLTRQYMNVQDPITAANFGQQAASLYGQYKDTMGLTQFQSQQLKSQGWTQRADIRQQGARDIESAAGAALERGILGSSADASARAQVKATTTSGLIASRDAQTQQLIANRMQAMMARREYQAGIMGLLQNRAAAKAMGAQGAYLDKLFDALASPGGGGGGGGGAGGAGGSRGGAGGSGKPSGGGYGINDLGPLKAFGRDDLSKLSSREQDRLKQMITNRMKKQWNRLENQGFDVYHSQGANPRVLSRQITQHGYQPANMVRQLTELNRRRNWVNQLIEGRYSAPKPE